MLYYKSYMFSPKTQQNNKQGEAEKVIKLLEKIEKAEKLEKIGQAERGFSMPKSAPTQDTMEVHLPLSYRQLSRIQ